MRATSRCLTHDPNTATVKTGKGLRQRGYFDDFQELFV
jgi:hypothetical protein